MVVVGIMVGDGGDSRIVGSLVVSWSFVVGGGKVVTAAGGTVSSLELLSFIGGSLIADVGVVIRIVPGSVPVGGIVVVTGAVMGGVPVSGV